MHTDKNMNGVYLMDSVYLLTKFYKLKAIYLSRKNDKVDLYEPYL